MLFSSLCACARNGKTIIVQTQADWDCLKSSIASALTEGNREITVDVKAIHLEYGHDFEVLSGVNDPSLSLYFKGNGVIMTPYGEKVNKGEQLQTYSLDDIFLDEQYQLIDNKEVAETVQGKVESVPEEGEFYIYKANNALANKGVSYDAKTMNIRYNVYRFKVNIPDLTEEDCANFYMLLSRQWAYYRHKVLKVEKGYLYFKFVSEEAPSDVQKYGLDPNSDITGYKIQPRYRFINYPLSKGLRVKGNKIDGQTSAVTYHGIGNCMIRLYACNIAEFTLSGFDIRGCAGNYAIGITQCKFEVGAKIYSNRMVGTSQCAIQLNGCSNVSIQTNNIADTRRSAIIITNNSANCRIENNQLKRIGWMGQTFAISANGENIEVNNNQIEDFLYSAISTGRNSNVRIVNNEISYSKEYAENYNLNTICDGGAIYIGPGAKHCVIADNLIYNICGNGANRGIFCDDGCCNMDIHGNFIIMNHHGKKGEYDIDLRYCETYKSTIPNHNTGNKIYGNYLTGYYRFQGIGNDYGCYDGKDYLFDTGLKGKNILNVSNEDTDEVYGECEIINGDLFVPQSLRNRLRRLPISKGFRKKIKFKKI